MMKRFILQEMLPEVNKLNLQIKNNHNYVSKKKKNIDPVTRYDLLIEKKIRSIIKKKFPKNSIIGEEYDDEIVKNSDYSWVIDPIDGTKALIMGQPTWSNLIGLYHKNIPILSMANFPILNKCYIADSSGAYVINKDKIKKIRSSKIKDIKRSKMVTNSIHTFINKKIYIFFKNYKYFFKISGSDAYNFCLLCEGKIDLLFECGLKQVDILPLKKLIIESGAYLTDWNGTNNTSKGAIILASNKEVHKSFLKILKKNKIK